MEPRSAIVIVMDRLGAGMLGPYGQTWLETPAFNRLASESLLHEFVLVDTADLGRIYESYWGGRHAWAERASLLETTLPAQLHRSGVETVLLTDEERLTQHPLAHGFSRIVAVPAGVPAESGARAADTVAETQLARVFSAALEELQSLQDPFLFWLHARAMEGPWDAPRSFRDRLQEEGDPPPPTFVLPPRRRWDPAGDPDELLGYQHAYGGQVALADLCCGAFLEALQSLACAADALLLFTSSRGFPLGEHGLLGDLEPALYGELLQVPCLLRRPDRGDASQRRRSLVQPAHLTATLADWFSTERSEPGGESSLGTSLGWGTSLLADPVPREMLDRAAAVADGERALRTSSWFLRARADGEAELYAKPDDRWEVNEVASRAREVVEGLLAALENFEQAARCGDPRRLRPLSEFGLEE